jgi:hypothetical protein
MRKATQLQPGAPGGDPRMQLGAQRAAAELWVLSAATKHDRFLRSLDLVAG